MAVPMAAHSYLGDLQDIASTGLRTPLLELDTTYQLPMLPVDDIVICPGDLFPLRVTDPRLTQIVRAAMQAPAPTSRLIAIIMPIPTDFHDVVPLNFSTIGCTVEIIKQSADGTSLLTQARQKVEIDFANSPQPLDFQRISMRIIPDILPKPLPFSANSNQGAWPRFVYQHGDATALAKTAIKLFKQRFTIPPCGEGEQDICEGYNPIQISYFLVGNAPFNHRQREILLLMETVIERLKKEIEYLREMDGIYCGHCFQHIAELSALIQIKGHDGIGGHFVNSHGALHDMLTLENAMGVRIVSEPEIENSWFPGYAWQIAYCRRCREHLGWYFTAVNQGNSAHTKNEEAEGEGEALLEGGRSGGGGGGGGCSRMCLPPRFYGLRTAALDNKDESVSTGVDNLVLIHPNMLHSDSEEEEEEEDGDDEDGDGSSGEEDGSEWETESSDDIS